VISLASKTPGQKNSATSDTTGIERLSMKWTFWVKDGVDKSFMSLSGVNPDSLGAMATFHSGLASRLPVTEPNC
jgi:hypothetical protein